MEADLKEIMEESLKETEFSIICKEGDVDVKIKGSTFGLAALIATIALDDSNVKEIIKLAVIGLNAKEGFDELGQANDETTDN